MFRPAAKLAAITSAVMLAGEKLMCRAFYKVRKPSCILFVRTLICRDLEADGALDQGVLLEDEAVGHAGDVVGHDTRKTFVPHLLEVGQRQLFRIVDPVVEERGND